MKMQNRIILNKDWKFLQGWPDEMIRPDYDDSQWRILDLPHDWSIEGRFSPDAVSYARGAYLPTGLGCYRKKLSLDEDIEGKIYKLFFEGVFKNSSVYLNGKHIGGREWGYLPFEVDLIPFLQKWEENVVVVKVDHSDTMGCRWYAGAGIYRSVYLETYEKMSFVRDGIQIVTDLNGLTSAFVNIKYMVKNFQRKRVECQIVHTVYEQETDTVIAESSSPHWIGATLEVQLADKITVANPKLWDLENPHLYCLKSQLRFEGVCRHCVENVFGFRFFEYSADTGFYLNHQPVKIKGCCLHNDGGSLGAAVTKDTFVRQIRILKTMGCNAVRTAHHPFSPDFLDVCDELGMLVLNEWHFFSARGHLHKCSREWIGRRPFVLTFSPVRIYDGGKPKGKTDREESMKSKRRSKGMGRAYEENGVFHLQCTTRDHKPKAMILREANGDKITLGRRAEAIAREFPDREPDVCHSPRKLTFRLYFPKGSSVQCEPIATMRAGCQLSRRRCI